MPPRAQCLGAELPVRQLDGFATAESVYSLQGPHLHKDCVLFQAKNTLPWSHIL